MATQFEVSLPPVSHCVISEEEIAGRRLFIVGDIHGCLDEFQALLKTASVTSDNAFIICTGDLVNKGPKNCQTVEFIRSLGARVVNCVRGNHDEKVIFVRSTFDENGSSKANAVDPTDPYAFVRDFRPEDIEYMLSRPYTISVPSYNVIVVHAGLVPGIPLDSQHPIDMTTMRGVIKSDDGSYTATEAKNFGPWAASWLGPQHVYFGHNASRGLQQHPYATGLDTGCVYGKQLTGALISSPGEDPVLFSVPAGKVYRVPGT